MPGFEKYSTDWPHDTCIVLTITVSHIKHLDNRRIDFKHEYNDFSFHSIFF